jgi:hypothetical protein
MNVRAILFRGLVSIILVQLTLVLVSAQDPALWLRYPTISPDGETILFSYK